MSQQQKLLKRLLSKPTDFKWSEALTLLKHFGFVVLVGDGTRRKFKHSDTNRLINIHVPHPQNVIKRYSVDDIINTLREGGFIK